MKTLIEIGEAALVAKKVLNKLSTAEKNKLLCDAAEALRENADAVIAANDVDIENAKANGIKPSIIDRLTLNKKRILDMADGLEQVADLPDPIGVFSDMKTLPNGLKIGRKSVPMGVIGIIYEARPNVTSDAFGLCLKAGSAAILRGGKEAINSNMSIINIFKNAIAKNNYDTNIVQLIEDTSHETAEQLMKMNDYLDLLIPRGGAGLINAVVKNSTVPVIQTGVGNCHIYIDSAADLKKGIDIIVNAKAQRPGVCNAAETMLVHKKVAKKFLPDAIAALREHNVEIRGDKAVAEIVPDVKPATEEDWATEYLDYILAVRVVNSLDEAIDHISKYSTGHSECIVSENYTNVNRFLDEVDAAAVYANASTRFTDGNEFGFGAEIGISTQKLHARGPMGLKELTTTKFIILGNGNIRS